MNSNNSEAWRFECECRHVLGIKGRDARRQYLDGVKRVRGEAAAMRREAAGGGDVLEHYMSMVKKTSAAINGGALALADKHLTESERLEWLALLHEQQSVTADLIEVIWGA